MLKYASFLLGFLVLLGMPSFGLDEMEYTGTIGGEISDIEIYNTQGRTFAYVARGGALIVYETTDPQNVREVNRLFPVSGKIHDLALGQGFLAAALGYHGTHVFSLADPVSLERVATIDIPSETVQASGYAALLYHSQSGPSPLSCSYKYWMYDLHDLSQAIQLQNLYYSGYSHQSRPTYYENYSRKDTQESVFFFYRPYPLTPDGNSGFFCFSLDDSSYTETFWGLTVPDEIYSQRKHKILFSDNLALMGVGEAFRVIDIESPNHPVLYEYPMQVNGKMLIDGNTAYIKSVTDYCVFDLSDASNIQCKERISFPYDPSSIENNVAYSIDFEQQLLLHVINGDSVEEASRTKEAVANVFCMAYGGECLYTSSYSQVGEGYVSNIRILDGDLENLTKKAEISLDGYFPFIYAQDNWLLVDNSTKLRLYRIDADANSELIWDLERPYSFPEDYHKEPSFNRDYDLLFEYPFIILSYAETLQVYEIVDGNVVEKWKRDMDWGLTALSFQDGRLYGMKVQGGGGMGLVVFELDGSDAFLVYDGGEFADSFPMPYGCISIVDECLFLLNYCDSAFLLYQYDLSDLQVDREYSYEFFGNTHLYYSIGGRSSIYFLDSRSCDYSFRSEPREQNLYRFGLSDPTNPTVSELFSLSPTIEPPFVLVGDSLLVPGNEAGIYSFLLHDENAFTMDWTIFDR